MPRTRMFVGSGHPPHWIGSDRVRKRPFLSVLHFGGQIKHWRRVQGCVHRSESDNYTSLQPCSQHLSRLGTNHGLHLSQLTRIIPAAGLHLVMVCTPSAHTPPCCRLSDSVVKAWCVFVVLNASLTRLMFLLKSIVLGNTTTSFIRYKCLLR